MIAEPGVATVDLGQVPARSGDRRRALAVALVIVIGGLLLVPYVARPLGDSLPVFAIMIALSISSISITAVLLWAQARVATSVSLTVLSLGFALTAVVMVPYLLFYRNLWPQLARWFSADPQTSGWFWVEGHTLFIGSIIAYYVCRRLRADVPDPDSRAFRRLQRQMVLIGLALLALTIPPLIWVDGLPVLVRNGIFTPLFAFVSYTLTAGALAAIVVSYRTSRFRSILDLWLAVACLSICADLTLQHFSHQFTVGWYASRLGILLAASSVLFVLLFQTANIYAQLAVTAERLRNESLTDVLTGLANRRSFDQRFAAILRASARTSRPLALLMIDIDHFKAYNDAFGHQLGDECLRTVAQLLLANATRARDVVARIGGEEMAVVMPEVDLPGALVVAERMRAAVENAGLTQGVGAEHPVVTISVGATATHDPARTSVEDLIEVADRALYRAKESGRNKVVELGEPLAAYALPNA